MESIVFQNVVMIMPKLSQIMWKNTTYTTRFCSASLIIKISYLHVYLLEQIFPIMFSLTSKILIFLLLFCKSFAYRTFYLSRSRLDFFSLIAACYFLQKNIFLLYIKLVLFQIFATKYLRLLQQENIITQIFILHRFIMF